MKYPSFSTVALVLASNTWSPTAQAGNLSFTGYVISTTAFRPTLTPSIQFEAAGAVCFCATADTAQKIATAANAIARPNLAERIKFLPLQIFLTTFTAAHKYTV